METLFVDVGNTSLGVGAFPPNAWSEDGWRCPTFATSCRSPRQLNWEQLPASPAQWVVATVNREAAEQLRQAIAERRPADIWRTVSSESFPVETQVDDKSAVGADRLAAAVAVNRLRDPERAAIVVDAGSAINVELVDERGVHLGGAILPGMAMSAEALAANTDLLPTVSPADEAPNAVGRNTNEAIRSGLYWGSWGAIQELVRQYSGQCASSPQLFLTGGGILWSGLRDDFRCVPHLVLTGIGIAWQHIRQELDDG